MKLLIASIVIVVISLGILKKMIIPNLFFRKNVCKEENITINDDVIDKGDVFQIIEPVWNSVSIYDGEEKYQNDSRQFSMPQKYVSAICWYRTEVNNGGHNQFYYNSTGIVWKDALDGFEEIELGDFYNILKESIERMGENPSMDRNKRQEQLDVSQADFEDLNSKFYKLEQESDLDSALLEYINQNRKSFYFNGLIKK